MVAVQNRQLQDSLVRSWVFEELAPTAYDVMTLWRYGAVQRLPNAVPVEGLQREPLLWLWGLETGMIFWICTSMYQQTAFFLKQLPRMTRMYHTHLNMFFFQPVPFFQVHLDTLQVRWQNHRLTGAVQLQGRLSKGARGLQRTKLWTLQSSQLQNQISIDLRPKLTNTSVRYQRMQSCTLHSARNRCSSG